MLNPPTNPLKPDFTKIGDEFLDQAIEKMVTRAITNIFKSNGFNAPVEGLLYAKLYSEYAKDLVTLWRTERKYFEPWMKYAGLGNLIVKATDECEKLIGVFDPAKLPNHSLISIFMVITDARVANEVRAHNEKRRRRIREVVEFLDRSVKANRQFLVELSDHLDELKILIKSDRSSGFADTVLGKGTLEKLRGDTCVDAINLLNMAKALLEIRNRWASLIGAATDDSLRNINFVDTCARW